MDPANDTPEEPLGIGLRYLGCTAVSLLLTAGVVCLIVRVRVGGLPLPWRSILYFSLFITFGAYQQQYARRSEVASVIVLSFLSLSMLIMPLVAFVYIIYVAISTVWWVALITLAAGTLVAEIGAADKVLCLIGPRHAESVLSIIGFVGLPVSAYLMFRHVP